MMKNSVYSVGTTLQHPLVEKFGVKVTDRLDIMLKEEGYSSGIDNGCLVINLDKAERIARPHASAYNETMDFTLGLDTIQMLLVELKLRVNFLIPTLPRVGQSLLISGLFRGSRQ